MLESRHQPVISLKRFSLRLASNILVASVLVVVSLAVGMIGYRYFEHLEWIDAFGNSSMLLSGMGPLSNPQSWGGKLFAGLYALYCGLLALITATIVLTPIIHRVLHRFHLDDRER